jgi:hypothetical protein
MQGYYPDYAMAFTLQIRIYYSYFVSKLAFCGAHPASYPKGTRGFFSGYKAAGAEADHLPPSNAEVK